MKYIYYYAWISLAYFHKYFSMLFLPIVFVLVKLRLMSLKKKQQWLKDYNESFLEFPGGMTDWEAFGVLNGLFLIPLIVFTVKYKIDIFYFIGIAAVIGGFSYYWIYYRSIEWLTNIIQRKSKKFYV